MSKKRKKEEDDEMFKELIDLRFENAAMKKQLKEINAAKKITKGKSRRGHVACPDCGGNLKKIDLMKVDTPVRFVKCENCSFRCTEDVSSDD